MSNLDQFFRNKFQDRDFEFEETYWEQAQSLIEEDRRRRRTGWWYWGGMTLLVFLGIASAVYFFGTQNPIDTDAPKDITAAISNENVPSEKATTTLESTNTSAVLDGAVSINSKANSTTNIPSIDQKENQNSAFNIQNSVSNTSSVSDTKAPVKESNKSQVQANQTATKGQGSTLTEVPNQIQESTAQSNTQKPISTQSDASQNQNSTQVQDGDFTNGLPLEKPIATITEEPIQENDLPLKVADNQYVELLFGKPVLPLKMPDVDGPPRPSALPIIHPAPAFRTWAWGLALRSDAYPAKADENWWIGGAAGVALQYRWAPKWSIQSEYLYHIRSGQFGSEGEVVQRRYGFGLKEKTIQLQPQTLHYLEWPVYLQWKKRRQYLEAGWSVNYLLGLRGEVVENTFLLPWERNNNSNATDPTIQTEILKKGWLENIAFQKLQLSLLLGYRYELSRHFDVSVQGQYQLSPLLKKDFIDRTVPVLKEAGPFYLRIGVTYFPGTR